MSSPGRGQRAGSRVSPPCPHLAGERGQGAGSSLPVLTWQGAEGRGQRAGGRVFPQCPHPAEGRVSPPFLTWQGAEGRGQGLPSFPHLAGSTLWGLPHQGPRPIRKPPHQLQHHIGSEDASVWIWRDADTQSSARCYEDFEGRDTSKGKGKHARVTRVREKVALLNSM